MILQKQNENIMIILRHHIMWCLFYTKNERKWEVVDEYKQFDIVYADLSSKGTIGSEQKGIRPVIIIQNDTGNIHSPTVLVMALTKELKKANQPTHYIIRKNNANGLKFDSMVLGETITQISKQRIKQKIGVVDNTADKDGIIGTYMANLTGKVDMEIHYGPRLHSFSVNWLRRGKYVRIE